MDFLFFNQMPSLDTWEPRRWAPGVEQGPVNTDRRDCYERVVARESPGDPEPGGPFRRVADAILAYHIFPPTLATPVLRRQPLQVGDTVGLQYHRFRIVEVFFASRVTERFDRADGDWWRTGFTYRTLEGHPELGEETFSVEKNRLTGDVVAALRSWSRPGIWLSQVLSPLTRHVQVHASQLALDHLQAIARGEQAVQPVVTPAGQ